MGLVGRYTLDLYCDDPGHGRSEPDYSDSFVSRNLPEAIKDAQAKGWRVSRQTDAAFCPRHNGRPPSRRSRREASG